MNDSVSIWTDEEKAALVRLGDLFIQGGAGMPKASDTSDFIGGTERVCSIRPDLIETAKRVIAGLGPEAWTVDGVRESFPGEFADIGELLAGAYFLDESVMGKLDYLDRPTIPLGDEAERVADMEQLVQTVLDRGNTFRKTSQVS
ncbi:hypothetical protein ACR5KS_03805 [Leucobacter sp. W1153]|uniref:hypothetical protein n=1 Tax=Leucobacter sp. W1153 TaxID=3439064 RepID=UPI003F2CF656